VTRRLLPLLLALAGCTAAAPPAAPKETPVQGFRIVHTYKHDPQAFTEGLFFLDGHLWESTGLNGRSSIREVKLETGEVLRSVPVSPLYFGEGIVNWGPEILSLTWQNGIGFTWRRADLKQTGSFRYPGEGWALTQDGKNIIMSDGTPELRFLDPATLKEVRRLRVTDQGEPVQRLNEIEYVKGEILANVWMTTRIARIDPKTGVVKAWIEIGDLAARHVSGDPDSVLNGIAYDAKGDRLFITGKNWPELYEIKLTGAPGR
jgi:glutaminyl-peptide cyclotransferase